MAHGGTLFLDEIAELPLDMQAKILRALQEKEFEPLGSSKTLKVDVRLIAATNRDLEEEVKEGRFRSDLFYRLAVLPMEMPPLRERREEDIRKLTLFFLSSYAKQFGRSLESVSHETLSLLMNYEWPGNVRELQNVIERAVVLTEGPVLRLGANLLPIAQGGVVRPPPSSQTEEKTTAIPSLDESQKQHILEALARTDGVIDSPNGAARLLGVHANTLRSRMKKLGITT